MIQSLEVGAPAAMAMAQESMILMPADAMAAAGGEVAGGPMAAAMAATWACREKASTPTRCCWPAATSTPKGSRSPTLRRGMGTEFRRLPIRMVLMMDERWLPKVLVECANSPLPIEVQRLRINREKSGVDKENQAV